MKKKMFFKIFPVTLKIHVSTSFPLVEAHLKLFFCSQTSCCRIYVNILYVLKDFIFEMNIQFRKRVKLNAARSVEYSWCCTCILLCFTKNCRSKNLKN